VIATLLGTHEKRISLINRPLTNCRKQPDLPLSLSLSVSLCLFLSLSPRPSARNLLSASAGPFAVAPNATLWRDVGAATRAPVKGCAMYAMYKLQRRARNPDFPPRTGALFSNHGLSHRRRTSSTREFGCAFECIRMPFRLLSLAREGRDKGLFAIFWRVLKRR